MSIYGLIPRDRYISRAELVKASGMSDRAVRDEINKLRKNPETLIISSSQTKGYKRPANAEEIEHCLYESKSRVKDELEKQKVLEIALRDIQISRTTEQLCFDF